MPASEPRVSNAKLAQNDALILQRIEQMDAKLSSLCGQQRTDHDVLTRLVTLMESHQEQHRERDKGVDKRLDGLETRDKIWGGLLIVMQGIAAAVLGTR